MNYRNGTYIAFHADGSKNQAESDIKYYRLLKAWHEHDDIEFRFVNSHEKTAAVRDSSQRETLMRSLRMRLNNSKNMVLIIGNTTRYDTDWVPFEISYAVDVCKIPIIAVYPGYEYVLDPLGLADLWPASLKSRIQNRSASVIHIPFKQRVIDAAIREFDLGNKPIGSLTYYTPEAYRSLGIIVG